MPAINLTLTRSLAIAAVAAGPAGCAPPMHYFDKPGTTTQRLEPPKPAPAPLHP